MGRYMVEELERYVTGKPLLWRITPELAARTCHRPAASPRAKLTLTIPKRERPVTEPS